ncbi:ribose-phosphate diphosphokinase [Spirochaeta cellobiosiphila]|uniref:ribose-phosphate diphosphokinase n=1 Tax=Spirochaeta cellobiosiphila TaxID=504483 RepID=UPI0004094105|nr:ribose-phosphate diphosphokinase [Spirochaeta cellobiosiphila]
MSISTSSSLGILPCPGGERFAEEIIAHLKTIYLRKFDKKATLLAKRYSVPKEDIIKQTNLQNDIATTKMHLPGPIDEYRSPSFRIPANFTRFANGEFKAEILSTVRGVDLFIVQDMENHYPLTFHGSEDQQLLSVNDHFMILLVTIDAALQAGASSVTVVIPSYPYARQHKKKGREGLTASRLGKIIENSGVERIITLDIHSKEIDHTFDLLHLENLHASYQILRKLSQMIDLKEDDLVIVSPDTGAVDRNKFYAGSLKKPMAMLYKERDYSKLTSSARDSNITTTRLLGEVDGKNVFMADDMLGTGGTLIKAMEYLKSHGAKDIICGISLPFFTGSAIEVFDKAYEQGLFKAIIGTNAVYHDEVLLNRPWFISANVSNLFARAISRTHHNRSLSPLLDNRRIIRKLLSKEE